MESRPLPLLSKSVRLSLLRSTAASLGWNGHVDRIAGVRVFPGSANNQAQTSFPCGRSQPK